jgi:hypothetical protein
MALVEDRCEAVGEAEIFVNKVVLCKSTGQVSSCCFSSLSLVMETRMEEIDWLLLVIIAIYIRECACFSSTFIMVAPFSSSFSMEGRHPYSLHQQ